MEKKNIDWENIGFSYIQTDKRYVSNYKDGKWDEGSLIDDANITMNECAGVLQYAQTVFEGMKAYTTEDGRIVTFRRISRRPHGGFGKTSGNAGVPGGPFYRCGGSDCEGKCRICSAVWFWGDIVHQTVYVRHQSRDWREAC